MKQTVLILMCFASQLARAQTGIPITNYDFSQPGPTADSALGWDGTDLGYAHGKRVYLASGYYNGNYALSLADTAAPSNISGECQTKTFSTPSTVPVLVTAELKTQGIVDDPNDRYGASLYATFYHADSTKTDYSPNTLKTKHVGDFDWVKVGWNSADFPNGSLPVTKVRMCLIKGKVAGTALWNDIHVYQENISGFNGALTAFHDDTFLDQYTFAYSFLKKMGLCGTEAAVPSYLGTPEYMSVANLHEMQNGCWEITNHTWDHQDLSTLTLAQAESEIFDARKWLANNGFGTINVCVYPFGGYNQNVESLIKERSYCSSARGTDRGDNPLGTFPYTVYIQEVDTLNPDGSPITMSEINGWINAAKANKHWLILLFHKIRDNCAGDNYCTSPSIYQQTITAMMQSGLPIVTYSQGLKMVDGN